MIESVKDYAIFMLDPSGHIMSWNEGARQIKGYEQSEIVGQHFSVFYTPKDVASGKCERELCDAKSAGRVEDEGWRVRKNGSKFWANVIISRLDDDNGNLLGFAKVTRDLTDRKVTEKLERAVSARDEFISVASHELKTPLTAIRLQVQIVQRQLRETQDEKIVRENFERFAKNIDKQVDRLHKLVEDMLSVTRIQRGSLQIQREEIDLTSLMHDVVERFRPELERSGSPFSLEVEDGIVGHWDRFRIEQVLINLLSNCAKYGLGKTVQVKVWREGSRAYISVKDHGMGISSENQSRIFERYERANGSQEISGLGLGLYISKKIIEAHGGAVSVKSESGHGSEFRVQLPI